jgi:hypothetical protein
VSVIFALPTSGNADGFRGLSYNISIDEATRLNQQKTAKLDSVYTSFASKVALLPQARDLSFKDRFIDFPKPKAVGGLPLRWVMQRRSWTLNLQDSDYVAEIFEEHLVVYPGNSAEAPQRLALDKKDAFAAAVYEPRWGVEVYHPSWDENFEQNARLSIGSQARWHPGELSWLPARGGSAEYGRFCSAPRGAGAEELLRVLGLVADIVSGGAGTVDKGKGRGDEADWPSPFIAASRFESKSNADSGKKGNEG